MNRIAYILLFVFAIAPSLVSAENFILSEGNLIRESTNSSEIDRIELSLLQSEANYRTTLDNYALVLNGEVREERTGEESIEDRNQITDRLSTGSLGVSQPLPSGMTLGLDYKNKKNSSIGFSDFSYSQSKLVGTITIDLLRDFLGRTSISELKDVEIGASAAKLTRKIDTKVFHLRLRRLFWDYIVAHESRGITRNMLRSDRKELKLAKEKRLVDAADEGDIARLSSQVSERTARQLQFEGTMKQLEEQFKQLLPQLSKRSFQVGNYYKDKKIKQFFACLDLIESHKDTPLENSLFDELVNMKKKQLAYRQKSLDTYSDVDVKLEGELGFVGSDTNRSDANDHLISDPEGFGAVGVRVTVPLDRKRRDSEETQLKVAQKQFDAESKELLSRLDSLHLTIVDAINLIKGVLENRGQNSKYLSIALKDSREKYRQARITSQQLLDEQDRYFNNELELISLQRDLLNFMLDYFGALH